MTNVKEKASTRNPNPSIKSIQYFNEALIKLKNTYEDQQQAEYIEEKNRHINSAVTNKQSALAWKTLNETRGRK